MPTTRSKTRKIPARDVERTVLGNGVRVISERVKGSPAVRLGLWVDAGARYEKLNESGATHLIQRMSLHGAGDRSSKQIAKEIDRLGGEFEIETERDSASYEIRTAASDFKAAAELIADLALRPTLSQQALSAESDKVLEELRALEKDAELVLERMFLRSLWKGHGLCRSPRGRLLTVKGKAKLEPIKAKKLQTFHTQSHHPKALTFIAVGNVRHAEVETLAESLFGSLEPPKKTVSTITPTAYKFLALRNRPQFPKARFEIGFPACAAAEPERYAAGLLNAVLGRGPSSRLALLATEGEMAALSVSSHLRMFEDVGCLSIRAWATRKEVEDVIRQVVDELYRVAETPIEEDELERARATRKAALLDEVDSLRSRAAGLARTERYHKRIIPFEEEFAALEKVSAANIQQLASVWINPYLLSIAVMGNLTGVDIGRRALKRR